MDRGAHAPSVAMRPRDRELSLEACFGEPPKPAREAACAPQNSRLRVRTRLYRLNENIVQTQFRGIMSARCTPEL